MVVVVAMMAVLMWLGLYPQAVLDTANPALTRVQHAAVEQLGTLWR
jgi:NADH:ubiquinone oxidoreductase subunit 4 (subunit M)